ncbi:MAG TPA: hypothetical protein VHD88_06895 [Pyrinomonadaceae bacterium]|nr:hypothetical protein [Pyrinomonadaceae bacterium]
MSAGDWIGIGIVALVIVGGLVLLNQITKPYDVKNEEEFERRKKQGGRTAGLMGLQQILDPAAKKSVEVQQDLRRGIYDDEEEPDDPPEAGADAREPGRRPNVRESANNSKREIPNA